jgi:TolB-like protein/Tfp pilus assembly protein PilF
MVLVLLVSRAGEVISREELAGKVWGTGTFVDYEQGLNFAVRQIRAALGDDADHPRFLETLPKRGYRFIAPVKEIAPVAEIPKKEEGKPRAVGVWLAIGTGLLMVAMAAYFARGYFRPRVPSRPIVLAVLPFDDLSGAPEAYLGDGLTEEMIARMTQISPEHLKVIARTSAMQYAHTKKSAGEIGRELGADYILENSIRRENGRLRITAQLVRTADQTHLWAENYDREMSELLPLESEVTSDIAEQIRVQLLPPALVNRPASRRPINPEAYQLYLKGRHSFNQRSRDGLEKSVELFGQAVAKEPGYAAAYAGMADAYNLIAFYGFDPSLNSVSQAKIAADKALQLDDSMAAAHAALAYTEFMYQENWPHAGQEFQRALELDDNYVPAHQWYALYLAGTGRVDEAVSQMQYAQRLDPLSPAVHAGLGYMYYFAHDNDRAIEQAHVALQLNPNFMVGHAILGWAYTQQRKYPEAIGELKIASRLSGQVIVYECALGRAYALSGNQAEAQKIVAEVSPQAEPRGVGSARAALYLALGDSERALHSLEITAPGDIQANWLRVDPAFDGLRSNPRFAAVVRRVGAPKPE